MATPYGVQAEGFVTKTLAQIQADIVERLVASPAVGPSQDYTSKDPLGQIIGAHASELAEVWELGYMIHTSGDPEGALDVPLDQLLSLTGSERLGAAPSRVTGAILNLDAGTDVPAGSLVSVDGRPDIQFALLVDVAGDPTDTTNVSLDVNGDPIVFECTEDGPIAVNAGTLTVIDSGVSGWNSVTNPDDAEIGRFVATNVEFRQRWADERARAGSTTVGAIRAALLDTDTTPEFETIEKVLVLQNKTDRRDANGLPPHSYEAIIDDGPTPTVDDDLIAQVLWDRGGAAGIDSYGAETGTATDSEGDDQAMHFSRVTRREIWIEVTITRGARYPTNGAEKIKAAMAAAGNDYDVSDDVIAEFIKFQAFSVAGVADIPSFAIGLAAGPTTDDNIPMGYRERATFSTARITVSEL